MRRYWILPYWKHSKIEATRNGWLSLCEIYLASEGFCYQLQGVEAYTILSLLYTADVRTNETSLISKLLLGHVVMAP